MDLAHVHRGIPLLSIWAFIIKPKRRRQEDRVALVTCGAVHHCRGHAVGLCLCVHQARAVVHGLAVGRAGGHESTLVHARKAALPAGKENRHTLIEHHVGCTEPWQSSRDAGARLALF